jgi:hypothetical protein
MPGRNPRTNLKLRLSNLMGILSFRQSRRGEGRTAARTSNAGSVNWAQTSWGQKFIKSTTLVLALLFSASITLADIKIITRSSSGGRSITSTTYIKGGRQRTEGLGYTTIYQCDLKRMIQLNDKTRSYLITSLEGSDASKSGASQRAGTGPRRGGVISYTTTSTDTGERKDILGFKAQRIRSKPWLRHQKAHATL